MGSQQTRPTVKKPSFNLGRLRDQAFNHRVVSGDYIELDGESFYQISNSDLMPPFFMSLVSASNHWMFVASNGAITAGRTNPQSALFPYYSADKLIDMAGSSGPSTIIQCTTLDGVVSNWEPFGTPNPEHIRSQNIYKNLAGNRLYFEEINHSLKLLFRYGWATGDRFGFIRNCHLVNLGNVSQSLRVLDGLTNVLPSCLPSGFQLRFSNLADAYKKNELLSDSQIGVYYLSSIPTDRSEPCEGLKATVAWQTGLEQAEILLSNDQVPQFLMGQPVTTENDIRGKRGHFLACTSLELPPGDSKSWYLASDVDIDHSELVSLETELKSGDSMPNSLREDVHQNRLQLDRIISSSDGIQCSAQMLRSHRHRANTTFNVMRGGIPFDGYMITSCDFARHVGNHNHQVYNAHRDWLQTLNPTMRFDDLLQQAIARKDLDLTRIAAEYLPITFSRRHGDPTRPWNDFSIDVRHTDGTAKIQYQGNWRDLFQNWEALGYSFPHYLPGMILRFVNASTADGYNAYRISKDGFDWEKPDPSDPWANIGYWGDHQIIYLLKLVEAARRFDPKSLDPYLNRPGCVFANVPYRIGKYEQILSNPRETITYDQQLASKIQNRVKEQGADGQLLESDGQRVRATLLEKILLSGLVKLSNLIPEAGIWLNTQRPEWNDANNALVGQGASVVTVCYLRRFFDYLIKWLPEMGDDTFSLKPEIHEFMAGVTATLRKHDPAFQESKISDDVRKQIVDELQTAGDRYRSYCYDFELGHGQISVSRGELLECCALALCTLDQTIQSNLRSDGLYHAYNLISLQNDFLTIGHLDEMLEGQVAVLSSTALSPAQAVSVLEALQNSAIFRADQQSYTLYPDRKLPRFMEKNSVNADAVWGSKILSDLLARNDLSIIRQNANHGFHFAANLRNVNDLKCALALLESRQDATTWNTEDHQALYSLYEATFHHHRFTGRSGTFFAYEGLGSIYWHMVSKLALAVQENYTFAQSIEDSVSATELLKHYRKIRDGLGVDKSPHEYGAFPTDPYSHTPKHAGVQQPGMTGQVKEDILCRFGELGITVQNGEIQFTPTMFESIELRADSGVLSFVDTDNQASEIPVAQGEFGFTFCQVPIIYRSGKSHQITLSFKNGESQTIRGNLLPRPESAEVFSRNGNISKIVFCLADQS